MRGANWIAMRNNLATDPDVLLLADRLGLDVFGVVGRLHAFWCWVDSHLENGNASVTLMKHVDALTCVSHFAQALIDVGWLRVNGDVFEVVGFDEWFSQSAKRRLLTAKRVALHRKRKCNADALQKRYLDKIREEKIVHAAHVPPVSPNAARRGTSRTARAVTADSPPLPEALAASAEFRSAWSDWIGYRAEIGKRLRASTAKAQLAKLARAGPDEATRMVRQSIEQGWQGIFEVKEERNARTDAASRRTGPGQVYDPATDGIDPFAEYRRESGGPAATGA